MFKAPARSSGHAAPVKKTIQVKKAPKSPVVEMPRPSESSASPESSEDTLVVSEDNLFDYIDQRLESAFAAATKENLDLENPSPETFNELIGKFAKAVSACHETNDNLLENVEARHHLKLIISYIDCRDKMQRLPSDGEDLAQALERCTAWLKEENLPDDKDTKWWAMHLVTALIDWTDWDGTFRSAVVNKYDGLLDWVRQVLTSERLRTRAENDNWIWLFLEYALSSVHNLARRSEFRAKLIELKFHEVAETYLNCSHKVLQCLAMIITAEVQTDVDSAKLNDKFGIIPAWTSYLSGALDDGRHRSDEGFAAEELAECANLLMVNDDNKAKFVEAGILPLLDKLIHSDDEKEQSRAVDCLWTLAFGENERQEILKMTSIVDKLKSLADGDSTLKTKAANASEFIAKGKANLAQLKESGGQGAAKDGHIFISYCWKQQPTIKRIRDLLVAQGLKVWLDIDEMKGSTLQAMAEGLENARAVLLCYSDDYKQSPNCRTEAEYAFQLQKPFVPVNLQRRYRPDGWLGLILGARFYIDMSLVKTPFEAAGAKLLSELNNLLNTAGNKPPPEVSTHSAAKIVEPPSQPPPPPPPTFSPNARLTRVAVVKSSLDGWKSSQVQHWFANNFSAPQSRLADMFHDLSGGELAAMYEMKALSAEIFHSAMLKNFSGSIADVLKVSAAVDRLPLYLEENNL